MTFNDTVVMIIDTSKCIGCKACQVACQQWNGLPAEDTTFTGTYQNPPDMSGANLTVVKFTEVGNNGDLRWLFFKDQCRHCDDPMCVKACNTYGTGAIYRHPLGAVWVRQGICNPAVCKQSYTYLRPCQLYCPFQTVGGLGIPRRTYKKNGETVGQETGKSAKCTFCYNRIMRPDLPKDLGTFTSPACMGACPPGAIDVNYVKNIRSKVVNRLNELKTHGYPNACLYPYQIPGVLTHVNWILTEHPSAYGLL
jgi:formate dehydrogenase iron-sulfur subunit